MCLSGDDLWGLFRNERVHAVIQQTHACRNTSLVYCFCFCLGIIFMNVCLSSSPSLHLWFFFLPLYYITFLLHIDSWICHEKNTAWVLGQLILKSGFVLILELLKSHLDFWFLSFFISKIKELCSPFYF